MADTFTPARRSEVMSRIRSADTAPEIYVRQWLHSRGFRFRLQRRDLPGRPDLALPKYRAAIFINGCFWHGHTCKKGHIPKTNIGYWKPKIERTIGRDRQNQLILKERGWRPFVIWECELKNDSKLIELDHNLREAIDA